MGSMVALNEWSLWLKENRLAPSAVFAFFNVREKSV
jgi:hypothetical protein